MIVKKIDTTYRERFVGFSVKEVFARGLKIITSFTSERSHRFTMWRHTTTGDNTSIYTRKQLFDTILHYWNRLHLKFRGGHCYFFPYYRYCTEDYQTVFDEKVPMTENDINYYEKWFKQVVSFFSGISSLSDHVVSICIKSKYKIKTRITASSNRMSFVSKNNWTAYIRLCLFCLCQKTIAMASFRCRLSWEWPVRGSQSMEGWASDRSQEVERWKTDKKRHQSYPDAMEELDQSVKSIPCHGEQNFLWSKKISNDQELIQSDPILHG